MRVCLCVYLAKMYKSLLKKWDDNTLLNIAVFLLLKHQLYFKCFSHCILPTLKVLLCFASYT